MKDTLKMVGRVSIRGTQLCELTGFITVDKKFPDANAFIMFAPGTPDSTKDTNRTYDMGKKETMKVQIRDLFALGEALKFAGLYENTPAGFSIFTDSNKYSGTQQGTGHTKMITVSAAVGHNGKPKVFISFKGAIKVTVALEKWHAIGIASQILNLADKTQELKFKEEFSYQENNLNGVPIDNNGIGTPA